MLTKCVSPRCRVLSLLSVAIACLLVGWTIGNSDSLLSAYRQWRFAGDMKASKGRTDVLDFSAFEQLIASGHRRKAVDTLLDCINGSDIGVQGLALELLSYCEEDAIVTIPTLERLRKESGPKDEVVFRVTIAAIRDRVISKFPPETDGTLLHGSHRIIRGTAVP